MAKDRQEEADFPLSRVERSVERLPLRLSALFDLFERLVPDKVREEVEDTR